MQENQTINQQPKVNSNLDNIKLKVLDFVNKIKPKLLAVDSKFETFMPNAKLRKIVYIATSSLFGFMFLIIILGLLFSPLRNNGNQTQNLFGNKPVIIQESSKPAVVLNENQKQINTLKMEIDNLNFPDTRINIPLIEFDLSINQSR